MRNYEQEVEILVNELVELVEHYGGRMTMDQYYNTRIIPENEELIEEFTDENGFDDESFVCFLVRRSNGRIDWFCDEIYKEM